MPNPPVTLDGVACRGVLLDVDGVLLVGWGAAGGAAAVDVGGG